MLSGALEQEHRDIDAGIEAYTAAQQQGGDDTAALKRAMDALRRHIYLEEEFIFPTLKQGGMMAPIFVMLREHGELWDAMDRLDVALESGRTGDQIAQQCADLLAQLDSHNSKEEPVIYPQVDAALDEAATDRLWEFLDTGRTPEGWVCERASA